MPLARQFNPEEIVPLEVPGHDGQSNTHFAQVPGVSEDPICYHLRRAGQSDRRQGTLRKAESLADIVDLAYPPPANIHASHG
jgi:hypothetical protein